MVSTLGIVHHERRALKGRQIERPNKGETGSDGPIMHVPHSDFRAAVGASFIWYPNLSPLDEGEPFILRVPGFNV